MDTGGLALLLLLVLIPILVGFFGSLKGSANTKQNGNRKASAHNRDWPADASPTLEQINSRQVTTCFARVITKRTPGGSEYYIGFEMEDGERVELTVQGSQYGVIIEGDQGMVSFRDGRMVGFDRSGAVPRKA